MADAVASLRLSVSLVGLAAAGGLVFASVWVLVLWLLGRALGFGYLVALPGGMFSPGLAAVGALALTALVLVLVEDRTSDA